MNIDYKKLLEQEPEAQRYVKDCLLGIFLADKDSQALLASIHSFYQIGMSVEDVVRWTRNMQRQNDA